MSDHRIPAIERAVDVLNAIADGRGRQIREIAAATGVPRSTVYRILNSLEAHAVVLRSEDNGYQLGPALVRLARSVTVGIDLGAIAKPLMDQLARDLECSVKLSVLDGDHALVVAVSESPRTYSITTQVGRRFPLHAGAASKLLAAYSSVTAMDALLRAPLARVTPRTITDPRRLRAELETIKKQGYAEDRGEYAAGVFAVAAPVCDASGACVGAISVPFLETTSDVRARELRTQVRATARAASQYLGGRY